VITRRIAHIGGHLGAALTISQIQDGKRMDKPVEKSFFFVCVVYSRF
jgi:hypothetical protein